MEDSKVFIPISLVGGLYQFLAKVLAKKIKDDGEKSDVYVSKCFSFRKTNFRCDTHIK